MADKALQLAQANAKQLKTLSSQIKKIGETQQNLIKSFNTVDDTIAKSSAEGDKKLAAKIAQLEKEMMATNQRYTDKAIEMKVVGFKKR